MLEVEVYPVFRRGKPCRGKKEKISSEAQKKLNVKNAEKKLNRLINTNFDENDIVVHGTYRDEEMPDTEEQVRKDINNYLRRIKTYREKNNLSELKYIYVIECKESKKTKKLRWHFHAVMSGMDRSAAEKIWGHGEWTNADRLQPNETGCEALAKYMSKDPEGKKRWTQSRNLKKPEVKQKDGKITPLGAKRMATKHCDDRDYYEKKYPGYRFIRCQPYFNEFNACWYVNLIMRKKKE
jgi:hypothetical protein